jgi:hypothetical protein
MKRTFAIVTFLLVLCLAAASWTAPAPQVHIADGNSGVYYVAARGVSTLLHFSSEMTEATILLCVGACLVALSIVLQRVKN